MMSELISPSAIIEDKSYETQDLVVSAWSSDWSNAPKDRPILCKQDYDDNAIAINSVEWYSDNGGFWRYTEGEMNDLDPYLDVDCIQEGLATWAEIPK